ENLKNNFPINIYNLWKIFFQRIDIDIDVEFLSEIISMYIEIFFNVLTESNDYRDYIHLDFNSNIKLIPQPINFIMIKLGFDGLLADDIYNNGWEKYCISYENNLAKRFYGEKTNFFNK